MPHSDPAPSPHSVPARRWSWWVKRSAPAAAVALCAWVGWREYDHRAAIREAQAGGYWWEVREPIVLIRADWRAAFHKETWTKSYWSLAVGEGRDLASLRLRPAVLIAWACKDANRDALHGLGNLDLRRCPKLPAAAVAELRTALPKTEIFSN